MKNELHHDTHDQPLDLFSTALTVLLCAIWGGAPRPRVIVEEKTLSAVPEA